MDTVKIRNGKVWLNERELKSLVDFEIKNTAENGYAEVKLGLLAKLV